MSQSREQATLVGMPGAVTGNGREGRSSGPILKPARTGDSFDFGGLGVEWKIDAHETGRGFSVVHHPMAPRALAAPLHRHHREDEYSYVLEGTLGALLDDDVVTAGPGTWVHKPRGQWHTFWNAGDTTCSIIEVISPGGFESYFREVAASWGDLGKFAEINRRYQLDMDFDSVPGLCRRFGLTFPQL
jgi:mannose-6-phosphate isomerase-like protein (cupin superfamily)